MFPLNNLLVDKSVFDKEFQATCLEYEASKAGPIMLWDSPSTVQSTIDAALQASWVCYTSVSPPSDIRSFKAMTMVSLFEALSGREVYFKEVMSEFFCP